MKNNKGFLHMAVGAVILVIALGAVVTAGFTYVAWQDIKNQLKCGKYDCSKVQDSSVDITSKDGNGGVLVNGVQIGD